MRLNGQKEVEMPALTYDAVLDRVQHLAVEDQLRLLADLEMLVRRRAVPRPRRSILELRGLGKEIWQGVDTQAYINAERDSWNG